MRDQNEQTLKPPEAGSQQSRRIGRIVAMVAICLLVVAALAAAAFGLIKHPDITASLRDVFIIVLALVTIIIGLFLIILAFQLQSLIVLLRDEIKPILDSANQTASTVRGTTAFVSDTVVSPMIRAVSLAAGVRRTAKTLAGGSRTQRGSTKSHSQASAKHEK